MSTRKWTHDTRVDHVPWGWAWAAWLGLQLAGEFGVGFTPRVRRLDLGAPYGLELTEPLRLPHGTPYDAPLVRLALARARSAYRDVGIRCMACGVRAPLTLIALTDHAQDDLQRQAVLCRDCCDAARAQDLDFRTALRRYDPREAPYWDRWIAEDWEVDGAAPYGRDFSEDDDSTTDGDEVNW